MDRTYRFRSVRYRIRDKKTGLYLVEELDRKSSSVKTRKWSNEYAILGSQGKEFRSWHTLMERVQKLAGRIRTTRDITHEDTDEELLAIIAPYFEVIKIECRESAVLVTNRE